MTSTPHDVRVVDAAPGHILELSGRLRAEDAAEIEAAGITARRALWRSYRGSIFSRAALIDGDVAAAWGCGGNVLAGVGLPWLLTAPAVERVKIAFLRIAKAELHIMRESFPELRGHVDARYHRAIRLLEALGFDLGPPLPFGLRGAPFREYVMIRQRAR